MPSGAPTGFISFLLTDVEDSTRLWEADRAGMAASLALHDELCRKTFSAHGGHVFSTAGDAFAVAFNTPTDAAAAACEIQFALTHADWPGPAVRVRIGLHAGTADERDGDYFGPTVNRAARIMSLGRGGHILVSSVVADALQAERADVTLVDRGEHRLTGVASPERVFELVHPDLPAVDGGLRGLPASNLPQSLSSFVGRQAEMGRIVRHLQEARLVTVTGAGGTGKTRLAVETGRRIVSDSGLPVWIVELASVTDPTLIMTAIGDVFGLRPGEGVPIDEVVVRHLASQELVLILDNCEHVHDGARRAVRQLLEQASRLRILATSREPLRLDGEVVFGLDSLPVPTGIEETDSVRLFMERARATLGSFEPDEADRQAVAQICRSVDGMPLGVELAAARLRSLSPGEVAARLTTSLSVLSSKSAPERHRTLEATIDWSYDLLEADEQRLFRRLSVFVTGFDLEAASFVLGTDDALDVVESLVDHSLIRPVRTRHGMRFRMLEPIRQYAAKRLAEHEEVDRVADAHADYFVRWIAQASPGTRGPDQSEWYERIDAVYDDVRAGFGRLFNTKRYDEYLTLGFDLFQYWVQSGIQLEGIATLLKALEADEGDPELRVRGWFLVGVLGAQVTSRTAIEHARRGLELANSLDVPSLVGRMELALGATIRHATTDPDYLDHLIEARRILDEGLEPNWWEPAWDRALVNLLFAAYLPRDDFRIEEHAEAALTTFERLGDRSNVGATLLETAIGSDFDVTVARLRQAVEIFDEVRGVQWEAHVRMNLGAVLRLRDEVEEAAIHLTLAVDQLEDVGDLFCWANASRWLALCELWMGMTEEPAARIADVIDRFDRLPMQEISLPRTVDVLAEVLFALGEFEEAARVLGYAESIPFDVATVIPRDLSGLAARIEDSCGLEAATRLREEGAGSSHDLLFDRARTLLRS